MVRDGLTREQVLQRLARQLPFTEKRAFAHYVIDTSGTKEATARQVETVFRELRDAHQRQ
jgi:dephospho-CoA kinase